MKRIYKKLKEMSKQEEVKTESKKEESVRKGTDENNKVEELIRDAITPEIFAQYVIANWGERIGIYPDGSVSIGQSIGMEIAEEEQPIVMAKCSGIGNIDTSYYSEGWTEYDSETGEYITEDGRHLDESEMITECCIEGDVSEEIHGLVETLIDDYKYNKEH